MGIPHAVYWETCPPDYSRNVRRNEGSRNEEESDRGVKR